MPTLLQINVVANWGSTGRIAEEIGQAALVAGWRSVIAYGRGKPQSKSELIRIGSNFDMFRHAWESRLFDNHGLASKGATRRFIRQIDELKPDVVHLHNIHGYYLNYDLLFQYLTEKDIPVVWTMHDCWSFTGHCAHFAFKGCNKWQMECSHCPLKSTYPQSWFLEHSIRNYRLKRARFAAVPRLILVPVSDWLAGLVRQSFFKDKIIHRIYNGVDTLVFKPFATTQECEAFKESHGLEEKKTLLGVSSIWNARKGFEDFMLLRKELTMEDYDIVLVGLNKQQMEHLPQGIKGVMRTNDVEELAAYYRAADVFVNTTYEDNFPTVNLEALACGTPVVTYQTGGSPEAVTEETGRVVEQGDIKGLVDAVYELTQDNHFSSACRHRAVECFDKAERYKEYIKLYNSLLQFYF